MERIKVLLAICAVLAVICLTGCEIGTGAEAESVKPEPSFELDDMYGPFDAPNVVPLPRWVQPKYNGPDPLSDEFDLWLDEAARQGQSFHDDGGMYDSEGGGTVYIGPKKQQQYDGYCPLTDPDDPWLK